MAARKNVAPKPEPVAVQTICSMCGLDWKRHGRNPTTEDCIRLLKQELASRPVTPTVAPYVPVPYPYPVPVPRRPYYGEPMEVQWSIPCALQHDQRSNPSDRGRQLQTDHRERPVIGRSIVP